MSAHADLIVRNHAIAETFRQGGLPIMPKLNTVILTCSDARVDPAHIFGLDLGEALVIRNNGGRVSRPVIEEIATLAVLVSKLTGAAEPEFSVVLMEHTHCGAERLADPALKSLLWEKLGIDVSDYTITDQCSDLMVDIQRLSDADIVPGTISVSALLYDVKTGRVSEVAPSKPLSEWRAARDAAQETTAA